jgi:hypothetical protein
VSDDVVRLTALMRLWTQAVKGLQIQHHDPRVSVDLAVSMNTYWSLIDVRMEAGPTRDTLDRDTILGSFGMTLRAAEWPGYRSARITIAGAWGMYMQHEVHELISMDGVRIADLDPHTSPSNYRQRRLESVLQERSLAIANAMDFAVGPDAAVEIRRLDMERAQRELETEIRVAQGIEPIWQ